MLSRQVDRSWRFLPLLIVISSALSLFTTPATATVNPTVFHVRPLGEHLKSPKAEDLPTSGIRQIAQSSAQTTAENLQQALTIVNEMELSPLKVDLLIDLAQKYQTINQTETALDLLQRASAMGTALDKPANQVSSLIRIALVYL